MMQPILRFTSYLLLVSLLITCLFIIAVGLLLRASLPQYDAEVVIYLAYMLQYLLIGML